MSESGRSGAIGVIRRKRSPVYVEWHIEDYFTFTEENQHLDSPPFYFCDDSAWGLRIFPNGTRSFTEYISLYLNKPISNEKYDIAFRCGIMKPNNSVFHTVNCINHKFDGSAKVYGWSKFLLRSELLEYKDTVASNGVLRVFCDIRFVDNVDKEIACQTHSPRRLEVLTGNLKDLYLGGRVCDVTITVKDKDFQAHKSILVARSPVFAAMFEHDMVEKSSSTVTITDCDANSFKEFLLFLYTGEVETILPSNVFGLYETANKYDVKELKEECVQLMEHNLSVDTFSDTVFLAVNYRESELLKSATEFFIKNVKLILPTVRWQLFMAENSCLANELLMKLFNINPATEQK